MRAQRVQRVVQHQAAGVEVAVQLLRVRSRPSAVGRGQRTVAYASRRHSLRAHPKKGGGLEAAQRHTEGCDSGGAAAYLHVVVARLQCTTAVQSTSGCVGAGSRGA